MIRGGEGERLADDARDAFYELGEKKLEASRGRAGTAG